jgi:hypothetical protein
VIIMEEGKRPIQFNLRTLLLGVSMTAIALGAARWLRAAFLPFVVAAVGIWFTVKVHFRRSKCEIKQGLHEGLKCRVV